MPALLSVDADFSFVHRCINLSPQGKIRKISEQGFVFGLFFQRWFKFESMLKHEAERNVNKETTKTCRAICVSFLRTRYACSWYSKEQPRR